MDYPFYVREVDTGYQIFWKHNDLSFCDHVHEFQPSNLSLTNVCSFCYQEKSETFKTNIEREVVKKIKVEEFCFPEDINHQPTLESNISLLETLNDESSQPYLFRNSIHCENEEYFVVHQPLSYQIKYPSDLKPLLRNFYHFPYVPDEVSLQPSWRNWTANFRFEEESGQVIACRSASDRFETLRVDKTNLDPLIQTFEYCDMRNCPLEIFMELHSLRNSVKFVIIPQRFYSRTVFIVNTTQFENIKFFNQQLLKSQGCNVYKLVRRDKDIERTIYFTMKSSDTSDILNNPGISQKIEKQIPILQDVVVDKTKLRQSFLYLNYRLRMFQSVRTVYPNFPGIDDLPFILKEFICHNYPHSTNLALKVLYTKGKFTNDCDEGDDAQEILEDLKTEYRTLMESDYPCPSIVGVDEMISNIAEFLLCFFSQSTKKFNKDELYFLAQENVIEPVKKDWGKSINQVNFSLEGQDKLVYSKYLLLKGVDIFGLRKFEDFKIQDFFEDEVFEELSEMDQAYLEFYFK